MKIKAISTCLMISVLLCLTFINAAAGITQEAEKTPPVVGRSITLDFSPVLKALGYSDANMNEAPESLIRLILESYQKPIPADSAEVIVTPSDIDSSVIDQLLQGKFNFSNAQLTTSDIEAVTAYAGEKACLIVGIGDYPGTVEDLNPWLDSAYDGTTYYASTYGDYDYMVTLQDSAATNWYIDNWIHWLCMNYENVDVYLLGHGYEVMVLPGWYYYAFVSYDAINTDGSVNTGNLYWDYVLQSNLGSYDHSTLRYTCAGGCYGWGFDNDARWPYWDHDFHARAFNGGAGTVYADYIEYFAHQWGYLWYQQDYDSSSAAAGARSYAYDHIHSDYDPIGVPYTYGDTGSTIFA